MLVLAGNFALKLTFLIGFAVVFGLVVLVPWTIDLVYAEKKRGQGEEPKGMPGLSRASMALSVLVVIGFGFVYLLVVNPFNDTKLVSDIAVALTTTLAAVVAFYFGSKLAQEAAETKSESSAKTTLPTTATNSQPTPQRIVISAEAIPPRR